jgi:hypothetical protein
MGVSSCNTLRLAVKKPCPAYKLSEHGITFKVAFLRRQGPVVLLVKCGLFFPTSIVLVPCDEFQCFSMD